MNKISISTDLVNDLKKFGSQMSIGMACKVRDELTDAATYAIAMFYEDYTPKYYKRHYYNFMDNSYKKYYSNPHNSIVYGGVYLSSENMDDIYQDNTEQVFDMVYAGYHGVSSGFNSPYSFTPTKVMTPSPMEIINEAKNNIVRNISNYKKYGIDKAKTESYETLNII